MRRLLALASIMVFFDVTFYAAIAPLLPDYVSDLDLSKASAGVLTASYAAGTLLASLPAGLLATRIGPRRTVIAGLALLGVSSLAFGFSDQIVPLDVARFSQGVAGAMIWSGSLSWLTSTAPPERRGAVIGTALGMAVAGALVGPVLGAIAVEVGTEIVFGAVLAFSALLIVLASRVPDATVPEELEWSEVLPVLSARPMMLATGFVAVPSLMFGAIEVLVPLRIDDLGGSHTLIAAGFVAGAAVEASLAPIAGRYSDRVGRRIPFVFGLCICAGAMTVIAVGEALDVVLAALVVSSVGAGICFTPAITTLSETAESSEVHQGLAAGVSNMAWAMGQVVGGIAGGGAASLAGYAAPSLAVALLLFVTAAYARHNLPEPVPQAATG